MMTEGIKQALQVQIPENSIRLVTFLTDGYIGNEHEILSLIKRLLGPARLFAFGVGTGVNRFLLSEMGHIGRGFTRYMEATEDMQVVAKELAQRLQSPVLTDIEIDWGELQPTQIIPQTVNDLFDGQSVRIQGRYTKPDNYVIKVKGKVQGQVATLPLAINFPAQSEQGEAIKLVWARSAIKEKMRLFNIPKDMRSEQISNNTLKQQVTKLGLDFSLVTQWTSFVAVSKQQYNPNPEQAVDQKVPLPMVKGVSKYAYGNPSSLSKKKRKFVGSPVPEPETIFGLLLIVIILGWFMQYRKKMA